MTTTCELPSGRYCHLMGEEEVKELEYGMDFREPRYRREVFQRFYTFHLRHRAHPGCVYYLMPYLEQHFSWTAEEALWFAYINGCTQHPPTSLLIFSVQPTPELTPQLTDWFNKNFKRLHWDTDRRYQKAKFLKCVADYQYQVMEAGSQQRLFDELYDGDARRTYDATWNRVRNGFFTFGRLSSFSYLEYLRIMGRQLECTSLYIDDMSGSKSHRNGIAKVCGRDDLDWHDSNPDWQGYTDEVLRWLELEGRMLLAEARRRNADTPWAKDVSYFTLESALCTYKSWHRPNRRYPNCYNDMLFERLRQCQTSWPEEDFSIFWNAREACLPKHLRREENPFDPGLVPEKQNWYRETGQVIMMDEDDPVFRNGFNDRYYM